MGTIVIILKLAVALTLINVWLFRFNKSTAFRGADAKNMRQEFNSYGLPEWFMYLVGALKVGFAILLIVSIWFSGLETISLIGIGILMLGALAMHIKINDELKKSMPAITLLALTLTILVV